MGKPDFTPRMKESAALLLLFSFFALIEGTIRMTANSKPAVGVDYWASETPDGTTIIPVGVFLMAGVAEVVFGMAGVFVAVFSLLLRHNNPQHTQVFAAVQCVLGWFVFLTFVIAAPILNASQAEGTALLSAGEQKALILLGNMLGSINFCYALQGGQFIFALRLMAAQKGETDSKEKNKMRAQVWTANVFLASFSTLFVGCLLQSKDFTSKTAPVGAPPHVVWQPIISIVCGIVMLAYAGICFAAIGNPAIQKNTMPIGWVCTTVAMMINFSWTFGIVPGLAPPIPGSAQHSGLILSVTTLPLFHCLRAHTLLEEEEEAGANGGETTGLVVQEDPTQTASATAPPEQVVASRAGPMVDLSQASLHV